MKIYLVSEEWRGRLKRESMRVYNNLSDVIVYLNDEIDFSTYWNVKLSWFRLYEFDMNKDIKPQPLNKYIKKHFVVI